MKNKQVKCLDCWGIGLERQREYLSGKFFTQDMFVCDECKELVSIAYRFTKKELDKEFK